MTDATHKIVFLCREGLHTRPEIVSRADLQRETKPMQVPDLAAVLALVHEVEDERTGAHRYEHDEYISLTAEDM